jgi:hypothetical protein
MTISQRLPGSPALARASLGSLLYEFLKVAFLGFGGGIVLAHRAAVERRRWLTEGGFTDELTFCPDRTSSGYCVRWSENARSCRRARQLCRFCSDPRNSRLCAGAALSRTDGNSAGRKCPAGNFSCRGRPDDRDGASAATAAPPPRANPVVRSTCIRRIGDRQVSAARCAAHIGALERRRDNAHARESMINDLPRSVGLRFTWR